MLLTAVKASFYEDSHSDAKNDKFKKIRQTDPSSGVPFTGSDPSQFSVGNIVEHERFGKGTIISIEGQPPNTTATVNFEKDGSKKLLLRSAKLRKV